MKKQYFHPNRAGFYGVYDPNSNAVPNNGNKALIIMLGDSSDDRMTVSGVKWIQKRGCHVMAMSPDRKDYGCHGYPLERIGQAVKFLKAQGNQKIGIVGASTTSMIALAAASLFPDITLTIAISPPDFIMEGFYQGNRDGAKEWPSNDSSLLWQGQPLPYLPYAYRHPQYWNQIMADSKASGDKIASRPMFEESERLHPIREEEQIKVENIKGKIIFVGAEDDVLWDTCKYIRRMIKRLDRLPHDCTIEALLYQHGTHLYSRNRC